MESCSIPAPLDVMPGCLFSIWITAYGGYLDVVLLIPGRKSLAIFAMAFPEFLVNSTPYSIVSAHFRPVVKNEVDGSPALMSTIVRAVSSSNCAFAVVIDEGCPRPCIGLAPATLGDSWYMLTSTPRKKSSATNRTFMILIIGGSICFSELMDSALLLRRFFDDPHCHVSG